MRDDEPSDGHAPRGRPEGYRCPMDHDPDTATSTPESDGSQRAPGSSTGSSADGASHGGVQPVDLRDYVTFERATASRVRVFQTDALAVDLWCVEPRAVTGALHLADQDVSYTVIAGRSWFVTDDGEVGLDPMGAMLVPADIVHGFENRGADPLIVLAACSPPGTDEAQVPVEALADAVTVPSDRPGVVRRAFASLLGTGLRERDQPVQRPAEDPAEDR